MKSRDEIIHKMCLTMRHDYGITKPEDDALRISITSGMTKAEQMILRNQMSQIFDNVIQPLIQELQENKHG